MTELADKEQAPVWAVGIGGMAAQRAGLARVVCIHLDGQTPGTDGLVGDHAVQFRKGPFRAGRIGFPLLLACLFAFPALGSLADVGQVFQSDQAVGGAGHDAFGNDMIGVLLQPSLPSTHDDESPRCRTGAFVLQTLSQSRVMVGFGDDALSAMETRLSLGIAGHGQVAHPDIHPNDTCVRVGRGVGHLDFQGDQQVELLAGLIIPEFGRSERRAVLYQGRMVAIARVRNDHPARQGEKAHLGIWLEAIIPVEVVGERGGDVLRGLIQPFVALLRQAFPSHRRVLLHLRPQALVGGCDLPGDVAGHLRGQVIDRPHLRVGVPLQAHLIAHLAVRERMTTHTVQGIAIGQLGGSQGGELLRRGLQFQFGRQGLFHRTDIPNFTGKSKCVFCEKHGGNSSPCLKPGDSLPRRC